MEHAQIHFVTDQSMAADFTSNPIAINIYYGYAIQAVYTTTGTLGGTFTLEGSVNHRQDPEGNVLFAGDWNTVEDSSEVIASAGSFTWDVTKSSISYVRLKYAHAESDSGTLNAYATIKGV